MPSEEDIKLENVDSLSRQRANRIQRSKLKNLRQEERDALRSASGSKQRRQIKGYYEEQKGKIIDVSVNPPQVENQDGATNDISQDGIDNSVDHGGSGGGGGGGGLPDGYVETSVTLCQNGSPVNGQILFKEDEEEEA
jgi:hypothetical protein